MNRTRLRAQLVQHEGFRAKPYRDTAGHLTIGYGRNLDAVGISVDEAGVLLDNDINVVFAACTAKFSFFGSLDEPRQHAIMDMAFNLGVDGLARFVKMLAAVEARDFERAADEMLASKWAGQVGQRAADLAAQMRSPVAS